MPNAGLMGGKQLAKTFDHHIRNSGQPCTFYNMVDTDGVFTYPKSGTGHVMIQEGAKARDAAHAIGLYTSRTGSAYFTSTAKDLLGHSVPTPTLFTDASYITDKDGSVWKVHSLPSQQGLGGDLLGTGVLVTFEEKTPEGFTP